MKTFAVCLSLVAGVSAQSAAAHVNDARSHGVVGDAFLSLEEGIRLLNEQLALSELSAAERGQIMGQGAVRTVVLEVGVTPVVTLERLLTPLDGPPVRERVQILGHGQAGSPVLVASGQAVGLAIRTNHAHVHGLTIRGGQVGLVADTSVQRYVGEMLELMDVAFEAQTEVGLRLQSPRTPTDVMLLRASFTDQATAIAVDDRAGGGTVMLNARHLQFRSVQLGLDVFCDADGGMTMCEIYHAHMTASTQFLRSRRALTNSRLVMLMLRACDVETTGDVADVQGNAFGETFFHHHHSTLRPGMGRRAIRLWPQDGRFDFHGSENLVYGDVDIASGRLSRRLWVWNSIFRNSTITISNAGTRPSLRWNRFEKSTLRAASGNSTQLAVASSEFYGCVIDGQSSAGPIVLENAWLETSTQTGSVQVYNPAPSPWLSHCDVSTGTPQLGGFVDLVLELPPGMAGVWHFGLGDTQPLLTEEPWRFYALRQTLVQLPGVSIFRTTLRLPIPVVRSIVGVEFYAQPVTVPFLGQAHVPAMNLPRGAYLTPQAP